jgi:hypothetical protein
LAKVHYTFGLAPLLGTLGSLDLTHVLLDLFLHTLLDLFLHTFLDLQGASTMLVEVKQQSCSLLHWAAKLPYRIVAGYQPSADKSP